MNHDGLRGLVTHSSTSESGILGILRSERKASGLHFSDPWFYYHYFGHRFSGFYYSFTINGERTSSADGETN